MESGAESPAYHGGNFSPIHQSDRFAVGNWLLNDSHTATQSKK
jgi:hypothetical protein